MRLRTQLVLAAFLLAVLPLTLLVVYSYHSSKGALEAAYRRETARMTRQMNARVATIRAELDTRMAAATTIPTQEGGVTPAVAVAEEIAMALGESAPLVESVEFVPVQVASTAPVAKTDPTPAIDATPSSTLSPAAKPGRPAPSYSIAHAGPPPELDPNHPPPPDSGRVHGAFPIPATSIVVDVPRVAAAPFTMPAEAKAALEEITRLGSILGEKGESMPAEERDKLSSELKTHQAEFNKLMGRIQVERMKEVREKLRLQAIERERKRSEAQSQAQGPGQGAVDAAGNEYYAPPPPSPRPRRVVMPMLPVEPAKISSETLKPVVKPAETKPKITVKAAKKTTVAPAAKPAAASASSSAPRVPSEAERQKIRERSKKIALILGREFNLPVETDGKVIGSVSAQVNPEEVVKRVLGTPSDDDSELAFAVDAEGNLYARTAAEKKRIEQLRLPERAGTNQAGDWIVATTRAGGLRIGAARNIGGTFDDLRRTAARNFAYGLALVFVAILGIVPMANHISKDVQLVTAGAERIAQGDLQTRVPVRSKNEFGHLATAFNRMAADLSEQRMQLYREEQARREQEVQQRLLAVEYDRKAAELEEARRFQLSMLPKSVPQLPLFDVAVFTKTATEVGGDYYDFNVSGEEVFTVAIGDATGHGAKAGTMVTVIKTLFSGYNANQTPAAFLEEAAEKIKKMDLGRMSMALSLARFERNRLVLASAGMPPVLIHRGSAAGHVGDVPHVQGGTHDGSSQTNPTAPIAGPKPVGHLRDVPETVGHVRDVPETVGHVRDVPETVGHVCDVPHAPDATTSIEEIAFEATPLGTLGTTYEQREIAIAPGDTILLMSDGLPELTNAEGMQFGYGATIDAFARAAGADAAKVIDSLVAAASQWHGEHAPNDDMTFVAVRLRA